MKEYTLLGLLILPGAALHREVRHHGVNFHTSRTNRIHAFSGLFIKIDLVSESCTSQFSFVRN